jgi:hypothetical protein
MINHPEKTEKRIRQLQQRINELIDKASGEMSPSELNKINKAKNKLFKEKDKLIGKLYPSQQHNQEPEQENDVSR